MIEAVTADVQDIWDSRFAASDEPLYGATANLWLRAHKHLFQPGMRVLCIAEGEGRNCAWLAEQGCVVTAFDLSGVGRDRALMRARSGGLSVDYRIADLSEWAWVPNAYSAVVAIHAQVVDAPLRDEMFRGIARTLVPSGIFVVEGFGQRQAGYGTGGSLQREYLYGPDTLRQAFVGWDWLARRDADVVLREGRAHVGRSHVISGVLQRPGLRPDLDPVLAPAANLPD